MSQPDSSLPSPIGVRSSGPSDRGTPYTMLLIVSLVAVLIGALFMLLEQRAWYVDRGELDQSPFQNYMIAYILACLLGLASTISVAVASRWN